MRGSDGHAGKIVHRGKRSCGLPAGLAETIEQMVIRRAHREAPTQAGEARFELYRVVENLDDPELPPVVESSEHGVVFRRPPEPSLFCGSLRARRIYEEGASAWS